MNLRKTISVLLVCMGASAPLLLPAYFIVSRSLIRYEMMEQMEKQHLSEVQIPVEEFRWYEKDKEILLNGKMFDVKSIRLDNGRYFITGLFDDQETALELALRKKMESSDIALLLVQAFTSTADLDLYLFEPSNPDPLNNIVSEYISPHFPQYCNAIVIPPPKNCLS